MAGQYQSAPRATTILDERKLNLTAAPVQKGAKPPSLKVGIYRNNPQFTVFPNCDNGSGVSRISAGMNLDTFGVVMKLIQHLALDTTPPETFSIANMQPIKKEDRTDPNVRQKTVSETMVGKDEDGQVWISVIDRVTSNAPKVKFYFKPDYYHSFRAKSGDLDKGMISRFHANLFAERSMALVYAVMAGAGQDPQNAGGGQQGGNKGGWSGNNNGGGNSYQKKPAYNNSSSGASAGGSDFDDGDFADDF
jgi:hypothetical protein